MSVSNEYGSETLVKTIRYVPESGLRRAESVLPSGPMSGFPGGPPLPLPGGAFQMAAAGSSGGGARPLLAVASSGDRCRINWTSGEYSPHFVSTCTGGDNIR